MNNKSFSLFATISILFTICFLALPSFAKAESSLYLSPATGSHTIGSVFSVYLYVNSSGADINSVSTTLTFDKDKLSVTSVDASESILTTWVEYPNFSNATGAIRLTGGVPAPGFKGIGNVLKINFKSLITGTANASISSGGQVLLSDGMGTNVLGPVSGGSYNISNVALSVSCSASPNSVLKDQSTTYTASPSGGSGIYSYVWSQDCTGTSKNCVSSYSQTGTKTAKVTITSGVETTSATCSANVNLPGLNVSCSTDKDEVDTGKDVTFSANSSGGAGSYTYTWSQACIGSGATCKTSFDTKGQKTAKVIVSSGGKSASTTCSTNVNLVCPTIDPGVTGGGNNSGSTNVPSGTVVTHSICSSDEKCVLAYGEGQDMCKGDGDCSGLISIFNGNSNLKIITEKFINAINSPIGSVATKTVATAGAAVVATSVVLFSPLSLAEIFLLPFRLLGILLTAFGLRKKSVPWGTVYDSVTKQPIDPAYVTLKDAKGNNISSVITDLDGRYGFLQEPNVYKIVVKRSNYSFPSQKLFGKPKDEFYENLYFGQDLAIGKDDGVIAKNIPLDPTSFDWNQFVKKEKKLINFYSKTDSIFRKISNGFFVGGFAVSIVSSFAAPFIYNIIILGIYLLLLLLRIFGIKPLSVGYVVDKLTGNPLSYAIIRVVIPKLNVEIAHKVSDQYGRYYCLVPKGQYYVKIERKNEDGTYSQIYTSDIMNFSKKGIIRKRFKV